MISYSKFPFLPGAQTSIIEFKPQLINYARDNIEQYRPTGSLSTDIQIFLITTVLLRNINNNRLTRKFVENLGKYFETNLSHDITTKNSRDEVMSFFDVHRPIEFYEKDYIKIKLADYLHLISMDNQRRILDQRFKLGLQLLDKGYVFIKRPNFLYLLRLRLEYFMTNKISKMKPYISDEYFNSVAEGLTDKYPVENVRYDLNTSRNTFPPCIKYLFHKAATEHHLNHQERIFIGTYLQSKGYRTEYILENIFEKLSDYSKRTTEYQLESLKKYKVYSCNSCVSNNLCHNKDQNCQTIISPSQY